MCFSIDLKANFKNRKQNISEILSCFSLWKIGRDKKAKFDVKLSSWNRLDFNSSINV